MMKPFCGLFVLLSMVTLLGAHLDPADTDEAVKKKLVDLNKRIEELRRQENDLLRLQTELLQVQQVRAAEEQRKEAERKQKEEAERVQKEAAEKKKQVAKVEIRGKLVKVAAPAGWQVAINDLTWTLDLGKEGLIALAEKNVGKPVVITGTIVNVRAQVPAYPIIPGIIPHPFPGYGYQYPQPPGLPLPLPPLPQPYPQPYPLPLHQPIQYQQVPYPVETPITVNVESLKVAQD